MSANKYIYHLIVIPEDQAVRDIVNGFSTCLDANERQFSVYDLARGWERGKETLLQLSKGYMREYPNSYAVLLSTLMEMRTEDPKSRIRFLKKLGIECLLLAC